MSECVGPHVGRPVAGCQSRGTPISRMDGKMATTYASTAANVRHTFVQGGAGVQLHVADCGNPQGRPILLIHGFSQSWLAWRRQVCSDLRNEYRLVGLDLRGHGRSDRPATPHARTGGHTSSHTARLL